MLILILSSEMALGANILAIFSFPSHSHKIIKYIFMSELASRGHNVTVVSPFPEEGPVDFEEIPMYKGAEILRRFSKLIICILFSVIVLMVLKKDMTKYSKLQLIFSM